MKPLTFRRRAAVELLEAAAWYEQQRPGLGDALELELAEVLDLVRSQPAAFPVHIDDARRALLHRFPYGVYFEEHEDEIVVLAICHLHRDPADLPRR